MKRILFSFLLLLVVQTKAQDFSFGAKAGLNLSTVTGDVPEAINPRLAFHLGGFVIIPISENISINPELLYFSIGNTYDYSLDDFNIINPDPFVSTSFKAVERANFLAVPINFRYNFTNRFGLDVGPQVGFLINTASKIKESNNAGDIPDKSTNAGNFRPDYGANLGFTFAPNEKLIFQLRYYQGLKNLIQGSFFPDDSSFNVALQLSAGYTIF